MNNLPGYCSNVELIKKLLTKMFSPWGGIHKFIEYMCNFKTKQVSLKRSPFNQIRQTIYNWYDFSAAKYILV